MWHQQCKVDFSPWDWEKNDNAVISRAASFVTASMCELCYLSKSQKGADTNWERHKLKAYVVATNFMVVGKHKLAAARGTLCRWPECKATERHAHPLQVWRVSAL